MTTLTNAKFNEEVDALWTKTKAGLLPRTARFAAIEALTDRYAAANGKRPEPAQLDRLATLCLYEEVIDKRKNKMQVEEAPILSDNQYRRRKEGKHQRSGIPTGEVSLKRALEYGTDQRNHSEPLRRQWSKDEALAVDTALSRDPEYADRYLKNIENGKVVSYVVD